ncbi:MAG: LuxR C-terminal-related transcriptional regulator, partial [Chloroflexi bacterium]|nr:LuxR C-terminal-related transcriptional regulator [Chloroflexota bacterium]
TLVGETILGLFQSPQPLPAEAIPSLLAGDFCALERDLTLVLDDYHTIQNEVIHSALAALLAHIPEKLHLVVSTRVDPPWPLARLRARNQLIELRAQDLRFTLPEAASFLNQMMGSGLSPEDIAALEERTEGWVAGLQLAALSMKGRSDVSGFINAFAGSHVYIVEYLVEEVLQRQPEEIQTFLLQTSILERLTAGLCEAITGCQDGQSVLTGLQHANLFVLPLDDDGRWFRYHHLFADLLQARLRQSLPPEGVAVLHQQAADWYESSGMAPEAIEHALAAKDYAHAIRLIEKTALQVILQAYVRTVESWLQAIPREFLESSPRIYIAFAWMNLLRGTFSQATLYLERLSAIFSSPECGSLDPSLQGEWLAIESKVLILQGKHAESRDLAIRALELLPEDAIHVRTMVYANLALAYQQMLEFDQAAEAFQMIVRNAQAMGDYISETLGTSGEAQMTLQQGRLHYTFEIASGGIKRVEASGKKIPFSATLYGEIGQIYYHWHQLDRAQEYLLRSMQTSGPSGYSDPEIYHHVMRSRIFQIEGDWAASAEEMQKARDLARAIPPAMIREEVISQQVRVDLACDRLTDAQELLKADGFGFDEGFIFPNLSLGADISQPTGLLYNSALRILLYQARKKQAYEDIERGIELASRVLAGELHSGYIPIALETLLLRSQMVAVLGDKKNSLVDIAQALELAEPEGFISIFLEEGEAIRLLIGDCRWMIEERRNERLIKYVDRLLGEFNKAMRFNHQLPISNQKSSISNPPIDNLVEPLTARELQVLQLIAEGCSNRAIAEKLVITVSAVKKHTGNIFGKLGVSSRTQAVAHARQLGLLPQDK